MIPLFKSSWIRLAFGVPLLAAMLAILYWATGRREPLYYFLTSPRDWRPELVYRVPVGVLGLLAWLLAALVCGGLVLRGAFLRRVTTGVVRLYGSSGSLLRLAGGIATALLVEPLFRLTLQPELVGEFGFRKGSLILAGLFAAAHWTPFTNLLAVWAFLKSYYLSFLFENSSNPLVPVLVHGLSDLLLLFFAAWLGRAGFTFIPPPEADIVLPPEGRGDSDPSAPSVP